MKANNLFGTAGKGSVMKKKFLKAAKAALACFTVLAVSVCAVACSSVLDEEVDPVAQEDFRVTAYMVGDRFLNADEIDYSHFDQVTDFIFMGMADFGTDGMITLNADFDTAYNNIKPYLPEDAAFYVNLLGPKSTLETDDWNEQMADQGALHNQAFASGNLEGQIKELLEEYDFDGVYFDYEYPVDQVNWDGFNEFIVSLDEYLGDDYKIGMALSDWDLKQTPEAMAATDFVEVMSYDNWDDDGNHAPYENAEKSLEAVLDAGYERSKIGLGLPFYARPTTQEEYWYDYKTYCDLLDENGLFEDAETGLTFSFNTYDVIKQKTELAVNCGLGGVMIWHYSCDASVDHPESLFNAIEDGIQTAYAQPQAE